MTTYPRQDIGSVVVHVVIRVLCVLIGLVQVYKYTYLQSVVPKTKKLKKYKIKKILNSKPATSN